MRCHPVRFMAFPPCSKELFWSCNSSVMANLSSFMTQALFDETTCHIARLPVAICRSYDLVLHGVMRMARCATRCASTQRASKVLSNPTKCTEALHSLARSSSKSVPLELRHAVEQQMPRAGAPQLARGLTDSKSNTLHFAGFCRFLCQFLDLFF